MDSPKSVKWSSHAPQTLWPAPEHQPRARREERPGLGPSIGDLLAACPVLSRPVLTLPSRPARSDQIEPLVLEVHLHEEAAAAAAASPQIHCRSWDQARLARTERWLQGQGVW